MARWLAVSRHVGLAAAVQFVRCGLDGNRSHACIADAVRMRVCVYRAFVGAEGCYLSQSGGHPEPPSTVFPWLGSTHCHHSPFPRRAAHVGRC